MATSQMSPLTPLQKAAMGGDADECRRLLDAGANVLDRGPNGKLVALQFAAANGYVEISDLLLRAGTPVDVRESDSDDTALFLAARRGQRDVVRLLMERGADVTANTFGDSLALVAVRSGNVALCADLVKAGISMREKDSYGFTLLHRVSRPSGGPNLNVQLIEFLVANGVDPNGECSDGCGPLDYAIRSRDFELCVELVRLGAETNYEPPRCRSDYMTPFQKAVYCGFDRAIEYFVTRCDEDPAQRTSDNRSMVQLARKYPATKALLRSLTTVFDVQQSMGREGKTGSPEASAPKGMEPL
jgi:ankyrin repeat protein